MTVKNRQFVRAEIYNRKFVKSCVLSALKLRAAQIVFLTKYTDSFALL
jgi:hypothetical protein